MSKRRDRSDSTYKPSAEAKPTREEQYQLRLGRYTVVLDESNSEVGFEGSDRDEPVAKQPVKVETLSEEREVEHSQSQEMSQQQAGGFSMEVFMRMMAEIETSRERRREEADRRREDAERRTEDGRREEAEEQRARDREREDRILTQLQNQLEAANGRARPAAEPVRAPMPSLRRLCANALHSCL